MAKTAFHYGFAIAEVVHEIQNLINQTDSLVFARHMDMDADRQQDILRDFKERKKVLIGYLEAYQNNLENFYTRGVNIGHGKKVRLLEEISSILDEAKDLEKLEIVYEIQLKKAGKEAQLWNDQINAFYDVLAEYGPAHASEELGAWTDQYRDDLYERKRVFDEQTARVEIARMIDKWKADVAKNFPNRIKTGEWTGGMVGVSRDAKEWWSRLSHSAAGTLSNIAATSSKSGKTLTFTLNHPDTQQPTRFEIDLTETDRVADRDLYRGDIEFLALPSDGFFGTFYTNGAQDFFRFEWAWYRDDRGVSGYYGERIHVQSQLPKSGVSTYRLVHDKIAPEFEFGFRHALVRAGASMKLFVDWKTDTVYGIGATSFSPYWGSFGKSGVLGTDGGPILYVGKLDRDNFSITGRYVSKPNFLTLRHAQGVTPENTSLLLYGKDSPNGIGGTFTTILYDEKGDVGRGNAQISGFWDGYSARRPENQEKDWYGFASGLFVNRSTGKVDVAYNTDSNYVYMGFQPDEGTMWASIHVGKDGGSDLDYKFSSTKQNSVYINKDAFAALEDVGGVPSYAATAMDSDQNYHYLSWGVWNAEQVGAPDIAMANGSHWVAGTLTPDALMPKTGSATYEGQVHGAVYITDEKIGGVGLPPAIHTLTGTSTLTADFGARKVNGSLTMNYANGGGHYATANLKDNVSITGNHFKGDLGGSDITSGKIHGAFYDRFKGKPAEIGGNWHIQKAGSQAVGVFAGKKVSESE